MSDVRIHDVTALLIKWRRPRSHGAFELGNLGDHKSVGGGVWEARVMFGPGYRVYFGKDGGSIIVLLVGGDKGSQAKDMSRAHKFWRDFLEAKRRGKAK